MYDFHRATHRRAAISLVIVAMTAGLTAISAAAEPLPRAVLIVDESDPGKGGPTTFSATLRATLDKLTPHVAVYGESFDLSRFAGPRQSAQPGQPRLPAAPGSPHHRRLVHRLGIATQQFNALAHLDAHLPWRAVPGKNAARTDITVYTVSGTS